MKKLLYPLLAVSIIFTACKIEEEGCTDPNAINYDPDIEDTFENYDGSCCYNIVGSWYATNTVIDSVFTVSYMGEMIDSLSNSGIREINFTSYEHDGVYYGPTFVSFLSDGIGIVDYNEDNIQDTLNYSINGNILMRKTSNDTGYVSFSYFITDEPDEYSPVCPSGTGNHLSLTGEEELEWKEIVDFGNGPIEIDIHLIYSNTLNFRRIWGSGPIGNNYSWSNF